MLWYIQVSRFFPFQVQYHVVFFDTPVSRGWINSHSIQLFSDVDDANAGFNVCVDVFMKVIVLEPSVL